MEYIKLVTGGGFIGASNGIKLYNNGDINRISTPFRGANETESSYKKIDSIEKINDMFTEVILNKSYHKPSNMSTVLTYKTAEHTYEWTFPYNMPPDFLKEIVECLLAIN